MKRYPDPDQRLFPWAWNDPADEPEDIEDDEEPEAAPPPLRGLVRLRGEPKTATLWGVPVTVAKATRKSEAKATVTQSGERYSVRSRGGG